MNYEMLNNNKVFLQGEIVTNPEYNHTVKDENFYNFTLKVERLSGQSDFLPVTVSERLMKQANFKVGEKLALNGQFRSYNKLINNKSKLVLSVFVREICEYVDGVNPNEITIIGYLCKPPIFRTTPFNRQICDCLLAVNRSYKKSDYIPCIVWGRNAISVGDMKVGDQIALTGRIQSRDYVKKYNEENTVTLTAYEVSVSSIKELDKNYNIIED